MLTPDDTHDAPATSTTSTTIIRQKGLDMGTIRIGDDAIGEMRRLAATGDPNPRIVLASDGWRAIGSSHPTIGPIGVTLSEISAGTVPEAIAVHTPDDLPARPVIIASRLAKGCVTMVRSDRATVVDRARLEPVILGDGQDLYTDEDHAWYAKTNIAGSPVWSKVGRDDVVGIIATSDPGHDTGHYDAGNVCLNLGRAIRLMGMSMANEETDPVGAFQAATGLTTTSLAIIQAVIRDAKRASIETLYRELGSFAGVAKALCVSTQTIYNIRSDAAQRPRRHGL